LLADRGEQVAVGGEAEPLVPWLVPGIEVGVDVVAGRELPDRRVADHRPYDSRTAPTELVDEGAHRDVAPPDDRVRPAWPEDLPQPVREAVLRRYRHDV